MPRFGAHASSAGRLVDCAQRAHELGYECLQLFARNPRAFRSAPRSDEEYAEFRSALRRLKLRPAVGHTNYLMNLASPRRELYDLSVRALTEDLERCAKFGAQFLVTHTGKHMEDGPEKGIARIARGVTRALQQASGEVVLLLENTAGAGTELGATWEELGAMLNGIDSDRIGVCLDTCHAHQSLYPLDTAAGVREAIAEFHRIISLHYLRLIHANDSKPPAGQHLDRHEHIGQGTIGLDGFRALVNHTHLRKLPFILETPKDSPDADPRNLATLRGLVAA